MSDYADGWERLKERIYDSFGVPALLLGGAGPCYASMTAAAYQFERRLASRTAELSRRVAAKPLVFLLGRFMVGSGRLEPWAGNPSRRARHIKLFRWSMRAGGRGRTSRLRKKRDKAMDRWFQDYIDGEGFLL